MKKVPPPVLDKGARHFRVATNKFKSLTIKIMLIIQLYIKNSNLCWIMIYWLNRFV